MEERLGHSSIPVTVADRCGHLFPSLESALSDQLGSSYREAVERFEADHVADVARASEIRRLQETTEAENLFLTSPNKCAPGQIRTAGLPLRRRLLYPLSYEGGANGRSGYSLDHQPLDWDTGKRAWRPIQVSPRDAETREMGSTPRQNMARMLLSALGVVVAGAVLGIGLGVQRARADQSDKLEAEQAEAASIVLAIDRNVNERFAQLDVAVSLLEAAWPLNVDAYENFLTSYRFADGVTNLDLGIVVEAVKPEDIAKVEERELGQTPTFKALTSGPPQGRDFHMLLMRVPEGSSRLDRSLMGLDVAPLLPVMGLPEEKLASRERWLQPIGAARTLIEKLVVQAESQIAINAFAAADVLAIQRMESRATGAIEGWFIVPMDLGVLANAAPHDCAIEVELLDDDGSVLLRTGAEPNPAIEPVVSQTIDTKGMGWRITVRPITEPPTPPRLDSNVLLRTVGFSFVAAVLVFVVLLIRNRQRGLRAELTETTRQATTDFLTGVLNRNGLERLLRAELPRPGRGTFFLLLLDVDRFKLVNDTEGHQVGDHVLQAVAERLKSVVGGDGVLTRFGGDEFVVVSQALADLAAATALADRIHAALTRPLVIDDGEFLMSVSIGISVAPPDSSADGVTMLRDADVAMYSAKRGGKKSTAVFDDEMRSQALRTIEVERDLHIGLRQGQIVPHFQPLFRVDGELIAFEALARWEHPERGLLAPAEFLDVAAESGCLPELNRQILRRSCEQGVQWQREMGRPVQVLVNLAEELLLAPAFLDDVERILEETGLPVELLTFEINEDTALSRLSPDLAELRDLARLGVKLAIDDFGRGRSSLLALSDLDMVTVLKLDRAFVAKLPIHEATRTVFQAVQDVARKFKMVVVGEGVETEEEAALLTELGIDCVQGYYYGRPAPAAVATELLRAARLLRETSEKKLVLTSGEAVERVAASS